MAPAQNPNYEGTLLGIKLDEGMGKLLSSWPFDETLGWYPYVTMFGVFHNSLSPQHAQVRVLDWCWMKFRQPKSFELLPVRLNEFLKESEKDKIEYAQQVKEHNQRNIRLPKTLQLTGEYRPAVLEYRPWLDLDRERDVLLFLSAIHLVNKASKLKWDDIRGDTKELIKLAASKYSATLPSRLTDYFQMA